MAMGNSYHIGRGREVQKCNFKSEQYQFLLEHFLEGSILCSKFMTPLLQDRCTMFFPSIKVITCTYSDCGIIVFWTFEWRICNHNMETILLNTYSLILFNIHWLLWSLFTYECPFSFSSLTIHILHWTGWLFLLYHTITRTGRLYCDKT